MNEVSCGEYVLMVMLGSMLISHYRQVDGMSWPMAILTFAVVWIISMIAGWLCWRRSQ
ncbi:MAG: hypothetical protein IID41_00600 [Planctomycetes bacterium]|nr:hypothetical protein [Planctomycetota bacterium]